MSMPRCAWSPMDGFDGTLAASDASVDRETRPVSPWLGAAEPRVLTYTCSLLSRLLMSD